MKNEIFDNMLSRYDLTTEQHKRNAIFEVNQQVILAGLYAGGFFESAPFFSELDSLMKETGVSTWIPTIYPRMSMTH